MTTTAAPASNAAQRPAKPPGSPSEQSFLAILRQSEKQIAQALPRHLTAERMMRMAVTIYHKTPALQKCSPLSIIAAVIQASELGLEISSPLGHAFIVPYAGQAQFQIGYKGYFELAYRTGKVSAFPMRVVYEHDQLEVEYGTEQRLVHKPLITGNRGKAIGYYAAMYLRDGGRDFEYMSRADVESHRDRYAKNRRPDSPWLTAFDPMALKTCVRKLANRMPLSTEIRTAATQDEYGEEGLSSLMLPQVEGYAPLDAPDSGSEARADESMQRELIAEIQRVGLGEHEVANWLRSKGLHGMGQLTETQAGVWLAELRELPDRQG